MTSVKINPINYALELPSREETNSSINGEALFRICIYTDVIFLIGNKNTFLYWPRQNILKFMSSWEVKIFLQRI